MSSIPVLLATSGNIVCVAIPGSVTAVCAACCVTAVVPASFAPAELGPKTAPVAAPNAASFKISPPLFPLNALIPPDIRAP